MSSAIYNKGIRKGVQSLFAVVMALLTFSAVSAQNPYMPLWEHIPDGEPYVFEDPDNPGRYRVYVYGSHDNLVNAYCGLDQVVWSAPVEDLTQWRYDGVCFASILDAKGNKLNPDGKGDLLYAPDIVEVEENGRKVYYFTPNNQAGGRNTMVAKGERPDGPFRVCNWAEDGRHTEGCFYFDPAIMMDDDGRAYGYWGFTRSYAAELDPKTMCSPKPGTKVVEDMVTGNNQPGRFRFFEASSIRKVLGKYVFIYSRFTEDGEFSLPTSNNTLAYAYSDSPLGPWTYGGTIIDGRARGTDEQGNVIPTGYCGGNTHGSICEINGKWWVFYHRHTGLNEYQRQAMVAPIEVSLNSKGELIISEGEVTSEGFRTEGLDPTQTIAAAWACHFTGPRPMTAKFPDFFPSGSYIRADGSSLPPVVNNVDGSILGYKYLALDRLARSGKARLTLHLKPLGAPGTLTFMIDSPYPSRGGKPVGSLSLTGKETQESCRLSADISGIKGLKGKHALYILFSGDVKDASLCELYDFRFESTK